MAINAGDLDRRITIERATPVKDEMNEPALSWHTLATVWASKKDVSDVERVRSQEVGAEITARFVIRRSVQVEDINPKDRIVVSGKTYGIVGVKEVDRDGFEISAVARAD